MRRLMIERKKAILALEDGTVFEGYSFTGAGESTGEVVFNTAMTGYQEVLTDPSYRGQIVTMTYPLIGNYGVNPEDVESRAVQVAGFIVKEYQSRPSNFRSTGDLADYLIQAGVMGLEGIDTRALTRRLRISGAMKGYISTEDLDPASLVKRAQDSPGLVGIDLVREVTWPQPYRWSGGRVVDEGLDLSGPEVWRAGTGKYKIVAIDYGIKFNILRRLEDYGANLVVVPADTDPETILRLEPDGVFLSNGPGDPAAVTYAIETIRGLLGQKPIFGICLGHQLLGLALGGETYKLKFGHRGANQPVMDLKTTKIEITSQNHGFCVDLETLDQSQVELTHVNLNDKTLEGFRHKKWPAFCVQYHPEASPGPHDADYLFPRFAELMDR
jgi:carbamoyl-phosphate synthase small subunit